MYKRNHRLIIQIIVLLFVVNSVNAQFMNVRGNNPRSYGGSFATIINDDSFPVDYNALADSLFARMDAQPGVSIKTAISQWYDTAQYYHFYDSINSRYVFAANNTANALLDWVRDTSAALSTTEPIFTANEGFLTNGTSSYIKTNYNPGVEAKSKLLYNSFSIYTRTNNYADTKWMIGINDGTNSTSIRTSATGLLLYDNNANPYIVNHGDNVSGHTIMSRINNMLYVSRNGGTYSSSSLPAVGEVNQSDGIFIGCHNVNGTPNYYLSNQYAIFNAGGALSQLQATKLAEADERLMDALGTGVFPLALSPSNYPDVNVLALEYLMLIDDTVDTTTPGTYLFDKTITIPAEITIVGNDDVVFKLEDDTNATFFTSTQKENISLIGLHIDGNAENQDGDFEILKFDSCDSVLIRDLNVFNTSDHPIVFYNNYDYNNVIDVYDSYFVNIGNGIEFRGCNDLTFYGNTVVGWDNTVSYGLNFQSGGNNILVRNNTFESDASNYFGIEAYTPQDPLTHVTIDSCNFIGNNSGISGFFNYSHIASNTFSGNSGTTRDGIEFFGKHTKIYDNVINNGTISISQWDGADFGHDSVYNNTVSNAGTLGCIKLGATINGQTLDSVWVLNNACFVNDNGVSNNEGINLGYHGGYATLQNIWCTGNVIDGNRYPPTYNIGIRLRTWENSHSIIIDGNYTNNTHRGIYIEENSNNTDVYIRNNELTHHHSEETALMNLATGGVFTISENIIIP